MVETIGETGNLLTRPELSDKKNEEATKNVVISDSEQSREETRLDLLSSLKKDPSEVEKYGLYGKKDEILKEMGEKYVNIEDAEIEGYKGKKTRIVLPEQKGFKCRTYEFFISNEIIKKWKFEDNSRLVEKSGSMKNVGDLLGGIREYMKARGVKGIDADVKKGDYKNALWKANRVSCEAGEYLKKIIKKKVTKKWLKDKWFWLGDKNVKGIKGSRATWDCCGDSCYFDRLNSGNHDAYLFLRLP